MDYNAPPPDDAELPAILAELIKRARHADADARREAIEQIYELAYKVNAKASAAIPLLLEALADLEPRIGESALWALHYCAPNSIRPLVGCLSHPAAFVRERAAHSLGNIGDDARDDAAPRLRELLGDPEQAVRKRAAWALGLMHDTSDESIQLLGRLITHGTPVDIDAALHALGNIGKAAGPGSLTPYRERILEVLEGAGAEGRRSALYAAESVGLDEQSWAGILVRMVQQDDSIEVRLAALSSLKDIASSVDLASALPILLGQLAGPVREASLICEILGSMRPRPLDAIPLLHEALVRDELVLPIASALWCIEGQANSIIPAMRRVFDDYGEGICDLICELGPAAHPLIPDLIKALGEEDWDLQWAAADALKAIASSEPVVVRTLLEALAHPSPIVKSAAARALAAAGLAAVRPLRDLLLDAADLRAPWAAYALGEMGPTATESLPELRAAMSTSSEPLAGCCAIAVAHIAADVAAVPYLVAALLSDDPLASRHAAANALASFGSAATSATEALEALVNDDDFEVAEASMLALQAIHGPTH